jgi:hypothetical protein
MNTNDATDRAPSLNGRLVPLSHQLIEELDRLYPAKCIAIGEDAALAHRYAGKRELIESLLALRDSQDSQDTLNA